MRGFLSGRPAPRWRPLHRDPSAPRRRATEAAVPTTRATCPGHRDTDWRQLPAPVPQTVRHAGTTGGRYRAAAGQPGRGGVGRLGRVAAPVRRAHLGRARAGRPLPRGARVVRHRRRPDLAPPPQRPRVADARGRHDDAAEPGGGVPRPRGRAGRWRPGVPLGRPRRRAGPRRRRGLPHLRAPGAAARALPLRTAARPTLACPGHRRARRFGAHGGAVAPLRARRHVGVAVLARPGLLATGLARVGAHRGVRRGHVGGVDGVRGAPRAGTAPRAPAAGVAAHRGGGHPAHPVPRGLHRRDVAQAAGLYLLPAAVAVGILRYRLLGIEVVLRRGLVYAALTAAIVTLHAVVALVTGARLTGGALPGVVAAAVVAVGLTPLRVRLQRGVDRLLYGHRSDPVRAVADLGDRMAAAQDRDLLDAVLTGVRTAVRAAGARIIRPDGEVLAVSGTLAASHDAPAAPPGALAAPLTVGGELVGTLQLAPRGPGERYSAPDERLVAAMAPQVAVLVRALDLASALERQRDAVVDARRAERDRLRRDLHDGLGPSLTGVGLGLRALDDAVEAGDAARAREIVSVLGTEVSAAVTEVRRILEDLRPAPVAEHGLAAALDQGLATSGSPLAVDVTVGTLPPMPPAVEDAVYRVALEAVTNVRRHARATRATVDVRVTGGRVVLRVADDGVGFSAGAVPGVGLASMRQRADVLGGELTTTPTPRGTIVVLDLPLAGTSSVTAAVEGPPAPGLTAAARVP
ncbi:hypothetical protein GB883_00930 [Georgenia thermotolerans]|uniref:Histidine kinase/HSP90-like ATPase domain-containing protein n=1 Tax=Georgenia thermotolerans TaxID=527326 RepID=A0A7J5UUN3_9MICO|nr:hypothetical protein GB883_00930 [Georgenia thermotolerans]